MANSISTKKRNIIIAVLACLLILVIFILTRPSHANILDTDDFSAYDTWDGVSISEKLEGEGTEAIPYFITSANDFVLFQKLINEQCDKYCDKYYSLKRNINFDNLNFDVIGSDEHPFTGTFDGNGYSIARVKVNSDISYVGFFAFLDDALVRDLNIKEATINGADNSSVGVLAGVINESTISNIGIYDSIINANDTNTGLITGTSSKSKYIALFINGTVNSNEEVSEHLVGVSNDSEYDFIANYVKESPNTYILESDDDVLGEHIYEYIYDKKEVQALFYDRENEGNYPTDSGLVEVAQKFTEALDNRFIWRADVDYLRFDNTSNIKKSLKKARVQPTTTLTTHASGQDSSTKTIYVNDLTADWNYYQGLNYTFSTDDGLIPDGTDQGKYTESNMVQMQITYDGSTVDGLYTGYISNTEQFNKMVYFHYYPVSNNGTASNTNDDYVEFELIDNPWAARPGDRVFNGWVTSYSGVVNNINTNYYYRYVRVPVTYSDGVPVAINITFNTAWFLGKIGYTSNSWNNIFSGFETAGFHTVNFSDTVHRYLPSNPTLFVSVDLERYESCEGLYSNGNQNPGNSSCQCTSRWGCTYYRILNNNTEYVEYDSNETYYQRGSNYRFSSYTVNTNNLVVVTEPNSMKTQNLAGLFTCQTYGDNCLIKPGDAAATYSSSRTYYYYATRDTNIAVLNDDVNSNWGSNSKPFTLTGLHNGIKYNTDFTNSSTNITANADTRIEFINTYNTTSRSTNDPTTGTTSSRYIYGNNKNLKIGRGMGRNGSYNTFTGVIGGSNNTGAESSSASNPIRYRLIVESGFYDQIVLSNGPMTNTTTKYFAAQGVYGNDVDRIGTNGTNVNTNLDVYYDANGSWGGQYATTGTASSDHGIIFDTTVKSGSFGTSKSDGMAGMYIGGRSRGGHNAASRLKLEGGYVFTVIGGPYTQNTARKNQNNTYFEMTGGTVEVIYGGAGTTACYGNRILQITGGKVNYSVFGGSNGGWGEDGDGSVGGSSFVYIGGNATIGDATYVANGTTLDITDTVGSGWGASSRTVRVPAGHVFGMGNGYTGYDDIGAMINSNVVVDGSATINGSVFGGGNEGAIGFPGTNGSSTSEVNIQILNGSIKGSVYGGGNNNGTRSGVTSTVNITMDGGTVDGSVYGGSCTKGVLRGNTNVNIYGGTVKKNVYGGGQGGIETSPASTGTYCTQACNVTIGNSSLTTTPTINGTVYGGSAFGTVNGDSNNNTVSQYGTTVTVNKGNIGGNVFGGSQGDSSHTPYVKGNIIVNINNGIITGSVFGTNDAAGQVNGTATVYLSGGQMANAYGGGNQVNSNTTNIYLQGSTVTNNVYGGGNQAGATTTNVHVTSGSASKVFGGSNQSGSVTTTNVLVQQNGTLSVTDVFGGNNAGGNVTNANVNVTGSTVTNVYGGNNLGGTTTTPIVTITGSTVTDVYGGGNQAQTTGNTSVTITNSTVNAALYGGGNAARVNGNTTVSLTSVNAKQVFGGGNQGAVGGNTGVTIRNSTIKDTSGTITDNIFGGGNSAAVEGSTTVNLINTNANNVFGGGNAGDVEGSTTLTTSGGTMTGSIYGGGNSAEVKQNTNVTLIGTNSGNVFGGGNAGDVLGNTNLDITNGTMTGSIYGGGNSADVTGTADTSIDGTHAANIFGGGNSGIIGGSVTLDINDAVVSDTIYGAGNAAGVTNDVTTTITGTTTASYIYGGGNNGAVGGDIVLNATGASVTNDIFGAGKGATATASGDATATLSNVHAKNIYGGGNAGSVSGDASISVSGSAITNNIYGGGNQAPVSGSATSTIANSSADNIFGGGNAGQVGAGATTTITSTNVTNDVYGGGNQAAVTGGPTTSTMTNVHAKNIYGGGNAGATGAISQTIDSSVVSQGIYGGGKGATATSTGVTAIVRNNTTAANIYGGGNAGPVNGNTSMTVNSSSTTGNIYGGGNQAAVSGTCGSSLDTAQAAYIYGGGNAGSCGSTDLIVNYSTASQDIYCGGQGATATVGTDVVGSINHSQAVNIFGGGNAGAVTGDIEVDITSSTATANIYGGGNQASVGGDIETSIDDSNAVEIYGGGNNGAAAGKCTTTVDSSTITNDIYGGGKGSTATVGNGTDLSISLGTTSRNVFGGGNAGKVTGDVTVLTDNSTFSNNIFGGGNQAEVEGDVTVDAGSSTACGAFGGGNAGDVDGNTSLTLTNSTLTCPVFGGGNSAQVTGNSRLYSDGSTITGNAFGGGNADKVLGNTTVIIDDTDITGSVYGGGNADDVLGNVLVIVGGDTTISDSLFGGGNSGAIGTSTSNNATTSVNLLGGVIGRNVYGGCNTSVVYGATDVNIGNSAANPTNLSIGDVNISGTVFGGGEANASGSADYDYSFISVTQGIDINIDGTGYEDNVFRIHGSIFGSGNASSSTGPAYIYIAKLGNRDEPNTLVSIQRATRLTVSDSTIELEGAVDRTNKYDSVKYSFNRVDELIIRDDASIYLQKNANLLKKWKSLAPDGSPAVVTINSNGDFTTKTADNRLYLLANTNLNVTLDQNATEYGEVIGMTFLGMYNSYGEGTFQEGMYGETFENGDEASGADAIIGGSYVLGLHASSMNYEIDGFYSNYLNDAMDEIETRYVEPSPPSADYYIWTIGIEATSYEFSITASKYSSLGTHVLSMMDFADGNTKFTLNGFNSEGLLPGVSLVNPANVPKIGLTYDEQNSILGLAVKAESQEWTSANSTIFTSEGTGRMIGDHNYETDNTQTSPSLTFYLYHAKNITDNRDLGAVTLGLQAMKPVNEFEWDVDLINITIYLDEQNYTDDDAYDASISYGRKYEMPSLTSVNITNTSQFTAYYSLIATNTFANIYGQNNEYYHALVSNYAFPTGTKITMLDLSDENNIEYFYYQVDAASYASHSTQLTYGGETEYLLSEFRYMDSTNKYYDDQDKNQEYYYDNVNLTVEEFVFIVDFEEAGISGEHLNNTLLFELRTQGRGVISVLGIRQDSMVYNLYEASNTVLNANVTYGDNNIYYGIPKTIGYDITVGYNTTQNLQSIVDTNYESDSMGINVELLDATGNQLTSSLLLGTSIKIGDNEYFPSSDGVFRIKLSNKVANLNRSLVLTPGSKLPAGNYTLHIDLFSSADGLHMTRGSDLRTTINLTLVGNANGISVTIEDNSKLINGLTGTNNGRDTSFRGTIEFSSDLSHTNIRLNVYKRDTDAYNSTTYTEVDPTTLIGSELPEFQGTGLSPTSTYQALISNNPTSPITIRYALTGTIPSGTYKLVFGLYDNNQEIQTDVKYVIVKID